MPDDNPEDPKEFPVTVSTFVCQDHNKRNCRHKFPHVVTWESGGIRKVLIDGAVFDSFKFQCPHCGGWNYHQTNIAKVEEQNELLYQILAIHAGQRVEKPNASAIMDNESNLTG